MHFVPEIAFVLAADDADGALEFLAINPQFTVARYVGQAFDEPGWSVEEIPMPGKELFAIPVGAHATALFPHPPIRQFAALVPPLRPEQRRAPVSLPFTPLRP